jgi:hypothetical protein
MRKFGSLAVAVTVVAVLLACGKKSEYPQDSNLPKPEPTALFKPAMSYWNFEKTRRELKYDNWEMIEDRRPLVSDKRPPFRLIVIRVPEFKDHGFTGSLVLWFYNDRLMKTQFYVPNVKDYLNVAGVDQHVSLGNDMSGGISPHTHVWIGKESDGRTYLGLEDEILKQQMVDWIGRYSAS